MRSNKEMLTTIANGLKNYLDKVYFVGGSVVELYLENSANDPIRPTEDVDCVLEITSKLDFRDWEKLFIMLPNLQMGFTNKWYAEGIKHSFGYKLNKNLQINLFELPYFLATKFEAVLHRGLPDLRMSHDFEDIVYLWNNVQDIFEQCKKAERNLQNYFSTTIKELANNWTFNESIEAHLPFDSVVNAERIRREMKGLIFLY